MSRAQTKHPLSDMHQEFQIAELGASIFLPHYANLRKTQLISEVTEKKRVNKQYEETAANPGEGQWGYQTANSSSGCCERKMATCTNPTRNSWP